MSEKQQLMMIGIQDKSFFTLYSLLLPISISTQKPIMIYKESPQTIDNTMILLR